MIPDFLTAPAVLTAATPTLLLANAPAAAVAVPANLPNVLVPFIALNAAPPVS